MSAPKISATTNPSTSAASSTTSYMTSSGSTATVGLTPYTAASNTAGTGGDGPVSTTEPNSQVERTIELTSFIDNQQTIEDARIAPAYTSAIDKLRQRDTEGTDVHKVAARPVFVQSLTWSAADVPGTLLSYLTLPKDILNISLVKVQKMQRYQYFSGDIVIRLIASTMAFQAGRLWVCYEAARDERGNRRSSTDVQALTALDGIEFNPVVPTPVEFRVKYFAPMAEWDRIGQYGMGTVLFAVLSSLNSASTSSSATFSVQAWFENLTFGVPTSDVFLTGPPQIRNMVRPVRQSGKEQRDAENRHVVSETLDTVSMAAGILGEIPLLGAVAKPVSWASGLASRAARMFGFSKPGASHAPTRVEMFTQPTAHHMDGASDAVMLAASSHYETQQGPYFGTEVDEMDIAYVCSRMPLIASYGWDATSVVGQPIATFPVMPGLCRNVAAAQNVTWGTYAPTPMAYVASMFKYWAGSLKFRLEAVSTPFHAGRLLIAYVPDFDPFSTFNITECANNYSILWDITTSDHIEFEVPFMSNVPYLETILDQPNIPYLTNGETSGTNVRDRIRKVANGAIVVFVLNQLVAPSTAANSVQLLVWMGGGKDITFMEPTLGEFVVSPGRHKTDRVSRYYDDVLMFQPASSAPIALTTELRDQFDTFDTLSDEDDTTQRVVRQSGIRRATGSDRTDSGASVPMPDQGVDPNMRGSAQNDSNFDMWMPHNYIDPMERAKMVSGECITNLRFLTRRMSPSYVLMPLGATNAGALTSGPPTSNHVLCLDMDYFSSTSGQQDNALFTNTIGAVAVGGAKWLYSLPTFLSYISYLYTYVRGTRRFLITSRPSNVINGAPFNTANNFFPDLTDPASPRDTGEFDVRVSAVVSNEPYTYQPWFRPEDTLIAYNYANDAETTSSTNKIYGLGSLYSSDAYVKRIGSIGTGLEVAVPPGTNLPVRLLSDPDTDAYSFNRLRGQNIPRQRRFLEIRYRPHSTAMFGTTTNFQSKFWPVPTVISEAAGDDLSFGFLQQPPLITRVTKTRIFINSDGGITRL